ncbi:MAG: hypothetical protein C0518_02590 [Opitutus sp.]|nr:hypothetical protein [Opitutus sp.]
MRSVTNKAAPVPICQESRPRGSLGAMGRPKLIDDEQLLAIARQVFRDVGPTAKTSDVAKAAGLSEAAIFKRFKTKDALFFAAFSQHSPILGKLAEIDATQHTPRTYLAAFGARAKEHYRQVLPTILTIAAHPKQDYGEGLLREIHKHNRAGEMSALLVMRLREWHERGAVGPRNVTHFAHIFLQAIHTKALIEVLSGNDQSPAQPEDMQTFVDVLWHGLKPPGSPAQ